MSTEMAVVGAQALVALVLVLLGRWGRGLSAGNLPSMMPEEEREIRAAAYRRGAFACLVGGLLLGAATVVTAGQVVAGLRTG